MKDDHFSDDVRTFPVHRLLDNNEVNLWMYISIHARIMMYIQFRPVTQTFF